MMEPISLVRVNITQSDELQEVFNQAPKYCFNVDGISFVPKDSAMCALESLPPGKTYCDKYVFFIKRDGINIGAIDLIKGYPKEDMAFIGLLLLSENYQRKGYGNLAYETLERFITDELNISIIQLSYVESNPVSEFWANQGYVKIGEKMVYEGINNTSFVQKMEKRIRN